MSLTPTRRDLLAAAAAAAAIGLLPGAVLTAGADDSIRPFTVNIPREDITELRRRIAATRWPDQETVNDRSQGYSSQDCRYGQSGTIILVGMPRGQHKVLIEVVDPEGNVFTRETVTFQSPGKELKS